MCQFVCELQDERSNKVVCHARNVMHVTAQAQGFVSVTCLRRITPLRMPLSEGCFFEMNLVIPFGFELSKAPFEEVPGKNAILDSVRDIGKGGNHSKP